MVYGLTSLNSEQAGPTEILAFNRGYWEIENRVHYVRAFTFDENRSHVRIGHLPRNLDCLGNAAISIVRLRGQFKFQPTAHRHYVTFTERHHTRGDKRLLIVPAGRWFQNRPPGLANCT